MIGGQLDEIQPTQQEQPPVLNHPGGDEEHHPAADVGPKQADLQGCGALTA